MYVKLLFNKKFSAIGSVATFENNNLAQRSQCAKSGYNLKFVVIAKFQ